MSPRVCRGAEALGFSPVRGFTKETPLHHRRVSHFKFHQDLAHTQTGIRIAQLLWLIVQKHIFQLFCIFEDIEIFFDNSTAFCFKFVAQCAVSMKSKDAMGNGLGVFGGDD